MVIVGGKNGMHKANNYLWRKSNGTKTTVIDSGLSGNGTPANKSSYASHQPLWRSARENTEKYIYAWHHDRFTLQTASESFLGNAVGISYYHIWDISQRWTFPLCASHHICRGEARA